MVNPVDPNQAANAAQPTDDQIQSTIQHLQTLSNGLESASDTEQKLKQELIEKILEASKDKTMPLNAQKQLHNLGQSGHSMTSGDLTRKLNGILSDVKSR